MHIHETSIEVMNKMVRIAKILHCLKSSLFKFDLTTRIVGVAKVAIL